MKHIECEEVPTNYCCSIYEAIGRGKHSVVYKGRKKKSIQYYAIKSVEKTQKPRVLQEVCPKWHCMLLPVYMQQSQRLTVLPLLFRFAPCMHWSTTTSSSFMHGKIVHDNQQLFLVST